MRMAGLLGCGALVFSGCRCPPAPLDLPAAATVLQVEVNPWPVKDGRPKSYAITDRRRIESILAWLRSNTSGYRYYEYRDSGPHPYPEVEVTLGGRGTPSLILYVGSDWLSGVDGHRCSGLTEARDRSLGPEDKRALLALLAL
jgi:hypothetical protein